jgi:uncharacterized glyoxalase superfamily protein PhnB
MKFASVRLVTADIDRLLAFYANLTGTEPVRLAPIFAEVRLPGGAVLAISSEELVKQFNAGAAVAGANRSAIIEFQVDDVDAEHARLGDTVDYAMPPATMPWGNRSMLLRDPDGNVVNVFARPKAA